MYFSEDFINEVKEKNEITDVISMYTSLKKNGNNYMGLCPFHSEKTPSFSVSSQKQMFHCFGCGISGTVIHFVEAIENFDFTEAVKFLAQRANIMLPDEKSFESEEINLKRKIYEMNRLAAKEFFKNLVSDCGTVALLYLKNRQITNETIKTFGLGYSKNEWDATYKLLIKNGYKREEIIKSGLCIEKNGKVFDFFRNRVMFPVLDLRGNVVAFGGRILDDSKPKYLNTGETPVFKKKNILFNMNKAKNSEKDYFLLMEGYMDVITVYQAGYKNAVASLGTAFTDEHSRLLKRFTQKVIISYDNDEAGREASKKAVRILKKDGINIRILKMKNAKDPDELIKKFGKESYGACIENAMSGVEYDLMNILPENGFLDEEDKVEFLKKAIVILSELHNPIETEIYSKRLAEMTKISYENIISQVKYRQKNEKANKIKNFGKDYIPKKRSAESTLIKIIVENSSYYSKIKDKINFEDFSDETNKKIFSIFQSMEEKNIKTDISMIMEKLQGEEIKKAGELFIEKEPVTDFMNYFESLLKKMKEDKFIFEKGSKNDDEDIRKLLEYTKRLKENKGK